MSTIDLVLLGMVLQQPQSAYDIHRQIHFRNLQHWVKIGRATVFKNMGRLEEKGLVEGRAVRGGNMPEKTVYHITPNGQEEFTRLMREMAQQDIPVIFDFNAVVANLNKLPKTEALSQMQTIRAKLAAKLDFISGCIPQRQKIPLAGRTIMRQQVLVLEALLQWADEFIPQLEAEPYDI